MTKDNQSAVLVKVKGYKLTEQTKSRQSEAKKGVNHPKFKGYYIIHDIAYSSAIEAAEALGTYPNTIRRRCEKGSYVGYSFVKAYEKPILE